MKLSNRLKCAYVNIASTDRFLVQIFFVFLFRIIHQRAAKAPTILSIQKTSAIQIRTKMMSSWQVLSAVMRLTGLKMFLVQTTPTDFLKIVLLKNGPLDLANPIMLLQLILTDSPEIVYLGNLLK